MYCCTYSIRGRGGQSLAWIVLFEAWVSVESADGA
jgi:hypothetical protein